MLSFSVLAGAGAAYGQAAAPAQAAPPSQSAASVSDLPPNPKSGECYARVITPAKYEEKTENVVVKEASQKVQIIPAKVETVEQKVTLKEESTRLEIVPAVYETVQEKVEIKPENTRLAAVPATYKTTVEQVIVSPAHTEWHRGTALGNSKILNSRKSESGELMCLIEVPAVYKAVTKTVIDRPASSTEQKIPAEYRMVTKQVMKTPPTTREVKIPAVYGTVKVVKVVKPSEQQKIEIPAVTKTITKRELVSGEKAEWRRVVCAVNLNKENTMALQKALQGGGFYKGPIDGVIGSATINAASSYAATQGLPTGPNYIVHEVVEKLNLQF
jgi:hypothetical protein